jgi:hypothetical protein
MKRHVVERPAPTVKREQARRWSLVPIAAVAALLSAGIAPARAQSVSYVDPLLRSVVRITEGERRERVDLIRKALDDIDGGVRVLLTGIERPMLITFDQLKAMARKLAQDGAIEPGEELEWTTERMRAFREAAQPVRDLLSALENATYIRDGSGGSGGAAQPPASTWFPEPMDWWAVRGRIGVDGYTDCSGATGSLPRIYSRWNLELVGNGTVWGTVRIVKGQFRDDGLSAPISFSGTIQNYRTTSGSTVQGGVIKATADIPDGEIKWTLALQRPPGENKIQVFDGWTGTRTELTLRPAGSASCQGAFMSQFE